MSTFAPAPEAPQQYAPAVEPPRKRASTAFVVWGYILASCCRPSASCSASSRSAAAAPQPGGASSV